jgi:hypothetical protein
MFFEILSFELKYRIKRPATWAYFALLFIFGWLIAVNGGNGAGSEKAYANSAYEVTSFLMIISIFATMIASAIMGVPVYRDIEHGVKDYFFSYPVREKSYLLGRYVGSFLILMLISTGIVFGMIVGYKMGPALGWEEAERFGPLRLSDYRHGLVTYLWPNLLFTGTIFFCLVAMTRKIFIAYVGSVVFFIGYLVSITLASDLESKDLVALLDPFGFSAWNELTKYWTPVEQNTLHQPLTGNLLLNRLLWPGVALLLLLFTLFRFDFARFLGGARAKAKKVSEPADTTSRPKQIEIPAVSQVFSNGVAFRQMLQQAWLEFKSILRDPYFIGIILGGLLFLFFDGWFGSTIYGTPNRPITFYMIESKNNTYILFVLIILVFYTGEVVHRDRGVGFHQIADALPVPTWAIYGGKFLTMVLVAFLLATMVWVIGIFSQTIQGYFNYDFGMYFTDLYLLTFPQYVVLAMLAFFVHVWVNKKFLGHVLAIAIYLTFFSMAQFADIDYNMFIYAARPGYLISDMNGFGHFIRPVSWFNGYWLAFGGILLTIGLLLWTRGTDSGWRSRLKQMRGRWNWRPAVALLIALGFFAFTGFTIYHNVSELNTYTGQKKNLKIQAEYEKKYSKYARVDQPKITDVQYFVDLFPEKRAAKARGVFQISNKSPNPIDSLYVNYGFSPKEGSVLKYTINGRELQSAMYDSVHQFEVFSLGQTMQPGDSAVMEVELELAYRGFPNEGFQREIIYNGSFLNSSVFPTFGYNNQKELASDLQRKKHDLEPKDYVAPPPTDSFGLRNLLFEDDADFVTFEAVISTAPDQIAMAPGRLEEEWEENGRRYFRYRNRGLIQNFFNISSAKYTVKEDTWRSPDGREVNIQIYHHPTHTYNLDRFNESVKASFDYFDANFSPFQFQQMRILEFPRYASFAQSFPNTVPYAESFGWVGDFSDPEDTDYAFYVTAHEVAHQWWGHQIAPSATRGANQISETMAQYGAMMVLKQRYGEAVMPKFLKYELNSYLTGRAGESKFEKTLLDNDTQAYVWYRKGANIMYTLQDYLGEDSLNLAFQRFLQDFAFRNEPPYATSLDWYGYIQDVTPDSLQYFLKESFEAITLYENKAVSATQSATEDGRYRVNLTVDTRKLTYDGNGNETGRPTEASLIEIGIFGPDGKNQYGMTQKQPLYLQKRWLEPGRHEIEIIVDALPVKAGIDPYNKLMDRITDDNLIEVE